MNEDFLTRLVREGYDAEAWHGPNLTQALEGVGLEEAVYRPTTAVQNVWGLVLHAAYWKCDVYYRLTGKRLGFPREGENWYTRPGDGYETLQDFQDDVSLLAEVHAALLKAVAAETNDTLGVPAHGDDTDRGGLIWGIAAHDVYHAGQVSLLRQQFDARTA